MRMTIDIKDAPKGYEYTTELRKPLAGEWYLSMLTDMPIKAVYNLNVERFILRPTPKKTIEDFIGKKYLAKDGTSCVLVRGKDGRLAYVALLDGKLEYAEFFGGDDKVLGYFLEGSFVLIP